MVAELMHHAHSLDAAAEALDAHIRAVDDAVARITAAGRAVLGAAPELGAVRVPDHGSAAAVVR